MYLSGWRFIDDVETLAEAAINKYDGSLSEQINEQKKKCKFYDK